MENRVSFPLINSHDKCLHVAIVNLGRPRWAWGMAHPHVLRNIVCNGVSLNVCSRTTLYSRVTAQATVQLNCNTTTEKLKCEYNDSTIHACIMDMDHGVRSPMLSTIYCTQPTASLITVYETRRSCFTSWQPHQAVRNSDQASKCAYYTRALPPWPCSLTRSFAGLAIKGKVGASDGAYICGAQHREANARKAELKGTTTQIWSRLQQRKTDRRYAAMTCRAVQCGVT